MAQADLCVVRVRVEDVIKKPSVWRAAVGANPIRYSGFLLNKFQALMSSQADSK